MIVFWTLSILHGKTLDDNRHSGFFVIQESDYARQEIDQKR